MANTFQYKEVWTDDFQKSNWAMPVYPVITDLRFEAGLKVGDTVHRRFRNNPIFANDLGSDGSYNVQTYSEGDESFTINQQKEASVRIPKPEVLHTDLDTTRSYGKQLSNALYQFIDGYVLKKAYQGAGSVIDDGSIGGTAGNGLTASITNITDLPLAAMERLIGMNVVYNSNLRFGKLPYEDYEGLLAWIVPPQVTTLIQKYLLARGTALGDKVVTNGYDGRFGNWEVFSSNSLPFSARLALPTNPTDGDTMTLRGVTFRFKNSLAAYRDIKIGATAADTADNIVAALNALTTGTANYDAWESTDVVTENGYSVQKSKLLTGLTATDGTTYVDLTFQGTGKVSLSETFTASGNEFTAEKQIVHSIFMVGKNISLAIRKDPEIYENFVSNAVAKDYVMWTVFDARVFADQSRAIIDVQLRADASSFAVYSSLRA